MKRLIRGISYFIPFALVDTGHIKKSFYHFYPLYFDIRLADELRAEQEVAMLLERDRKLLEAQVSMHRTHLPGIWQNSKK